MFFLYHHQKNSRRWNGKEVKVTINDRGPHGGGRIIDLSRAAARKLAMGGSARVSIVALSN
jgi:rare lipoprotein A